MAGYVRVNDARLTLTAEQSRVVGFVTSGGDPTPSHNSSYSRAGLARTIQGLISLGVIQRSAHNNGFILADGVIPLWGIEPEQCLCEGEVKHDCGQCIHALKLGRAEPCSVCIQPSDNDFGGHLSCFYHPSSADIKVIHYRRMLKKVLTYADELVYRYVDDEELSKAHHAQLAAMVEDPK